MVVLEPRDMLDQQLGCLPVARADLLIKAVRESGRLRTVRLGGFLGNFLGRKTRRFEELSALRLVENPLIEHDAFEHRRGNHFEDDLREVHTTCSAMY